MSETETSAPGLGGLPPWYLEIRPGGGREGFYWKLADHSAVFVDRGAHQLVVSFDNLSDAGNPRFDRDIWAGKFCQDNGWSHLGIFAPGPSWFRDAGLIGYLERLRDDGFFSRFDRVCLCGASMGGFAALTFARLAPGATVIAFSPQTTLDLRRVPWETRFVKGTQQDWTLPYSDAAGQTGTAGPVYVVYDPFVEKDLRQAHRLSGSNIHHLKAFWLGHKTALVFRRMDQLKPLMHAAITGKLDMTTYYRLLRARRSIYLYRRNVEEHLIARDRAVLLNLFREAFKKMRREAQEASTMTTPTG